MFDKLPSLRGFQPKFYSGGPARFHLSLLYDLVAETKPKRVVAVGFGDGQAFFTFCQAVHEQKLDCTCFAVRRDRSAKSEEDDVAWREGRDYGEEFYGARAGFFSSPSAALAKTPDGSVDILLLDDSDSGKEIREDLCAWESKLAPGAIVLLHGLGLERQDAPGTVWDEWVANRPHAIYPEGLGLGIAQRSENATSSLLLKASELAEFYVLAAARIDAFARAAEAEKRVAAFETRQVWLDSLLTDRRKVQEIMDHQARAIASFEQRIQLLLAAQEEQRGHFENLRRDRAKAQLIMDAQHEQLKRFVAQTDTLKAKVETLKTQLQEHKAILKAAKQACRKKGRCFQIETGPKVRRPFAEKIARELRRLPRNLGIGRKNKETLPASQKMEDAVPSGSPADRYEAWIAEHEPDAGGLEKQRQSSREFPTRVKISLLTPVHNTPATFLEEMFASVLAQTYDNWELCIVDAASDRAETIET